MSLHHISGRASLTPSRRSVDAAFEEAVQHFGRIDVVVNNAGYGLRGVFESISEDQGRTQMEVNFFGVVNVTRSAIKTFRAINKPVGGRVIQVSSIGGQRGMPTFSFYNASKFAIEGFTEGLAKELKPEWDIHLTLIEPGAFRTEWAGHSMAFGEIEQPAYDHLDVARLTQEMNGRQSGDPVKGARAFWDIAKMDDPPLRVVIGSDAQRGMANKIQEYSDHYLDQKWKAFASSTDFD